MQTIQSAISNVLYLIIDEMSMVGSLVPPPVPGAPPVASFRGLKEDFPHCCLDLVLTDSYLPRSPARCLFF